MFKRPTTKLILGAAVALGLLIYFLASEPPAWIQHSKMAWIVVRLVAGILGLALGYLVFTSGNILLGAKELQLESKYVKDHNDIDLREAGYSTLDILLIEAPLMSWLVWWFICFELMASFYVSDWCVNGF